MINYAGYSFDIIHMKEKTFLTNFPNSPAIVRKVAFVIVLRESHLTLLYSLFIPVISSSVKTVVNRYLSCCSVL